MIRFSCLSDDSWMPLELVSEYPHSRTLWKEFLLAITKLRRFPTLLLTAVVMLFAFAAGRIKDEHKCFEISPSALGGASSV
jgi:hypothetical protein